MENTLFAPFNTALVIFLSFFTLAIIVLLFWIFVINRKKHVPTQALTEQQKANIVCCGLLHFTNQSAVDAILNDDCIIRPSKDFIYRAEKNYTWFFPATLPIEESIRRTYESIKKIRSSTEFCLHITGINENETHEFLYNPLKNYIAHKGALQKTVSVYYLTDGHWMPFDHTNHADVELRE